MERQGVSLLSIQVVSRLILRQVILSQTESCGCDRDAELADVIGVLW